KGDIELLFIAGEYLSDLVDMSIYTAASKDKIQWLQLQKELADDLEDELLLKFLLAQDLEAPGEEWL
ncbi:hypothetical protein LRR18_17400, partial [Mangrovimonas sp. AS39]|uniref:hypothetical protein n=1 Tax=Mangrovimonas futianensis TaxID=2895523 RepID=UPI001E2FD38A